MKHGSGARAVPGGVKVRDRRVGGWQRRAQGWVGRASGAPGVYVSCPPQPCPACRRTRKKVTSTLQVPGPSRSWDPAPAVLSLRRSQCPCAGCSCYPRSLGSSCSRESALTNRIVDLAVPAGSPSANMDARARETEPMTAAGAWNAEADLSTARTCHVGTHRCVSEVYWAQWQA